jgi:hypothetical protein
LKCLSPAHWAFHHDGTCRNGRSAQLAKRTLGQYPAVSGALSCFKPNILDFNIESVPRINHTGQSVMRHRAEASIDSPQ